MILGRCYICLFSLRRVSETAKMIYSMRPMLFFFSLRWVWWLPKWLIEMRPRFLYRKMSLLSDERRPRSDRDPSVIYTCIPLFLFFPVAFCNQVDVGASCTRVVLLRPSIARSTVLAHCLSSDPHSVLVARPRLVSARGNSSGLSYWAPSHFRVI